MAKLFDTMKNNVELVRRTKSLIRDVYMSDQIPWVIGYSGGKDSTLATQIIINTLMDMKRDGEELNKKVYVISSDTLVETPLIIETIRKSLDGINELAKKEDLPISAHVVSPLFSQTFWVNIIGRGYPTPNQTFRWCTDRMKIDPANRFIKSIVGKYGHAIMVLGVRDGESQSRDRVIEKHSVGEKKLLKHSTMINTYVFAPIRAFSIDQVWNYLLNNDSPWGGDNQELYRLYSDSATECPLIVDQNIKNEAGSCGNSRFGCWTCTVVSEDKSLTGFINSGVEWLRPLLEYRNWLASIRDDSTRRMKRRTNGALYFSKILQLSDDYLIIPVKGSREKRTLRKQEDGSWIDSKGEKWNVFEDSQTAESQAKKFIVEHGVDLDSGENPRIIIRNHEGGYSQLGNGPFTMEARKEILKKLLLVEKDLPGDYQLIRQEELNEIRKIWIERGDRFDSVVSIYNDVYNTDFPYIENDITLFDQEDWSILENLCDKHGIDLDVITQLIRNGSEHAGYNSRKDAVRSIERLLNRESLHIQEIHGDHHDH